MSGLISIAKGVWVSREQIEGIVHITAYGGHDSAKIPPSVRIKFPDYETGWDFKTYEAAIEFADSIAAMIDDILAPKERGSE